MNWSYSLERLPSETMMNSHIVTVLSYPRDPKETINVRFWTNLDEHAVSLSASTPVIMYAEVTVNYAPVVDASVIVELQAINQSGYLTPLIYIPLLDNGNGDPDLFSQDGIYSRYLTQVPSEGRYTITLRVNDNYGKAFAPLKSYGDNSRSCCQDQYQKVSNQKLGAFTRIHWGDSFRIHNMEKGSMPPSRILNLAVTMLPKTDELEFTWISPGDDFDYGKPTSYQLYLATDSSKFYDNIKKTSLVESFSAVKPAGIQETRKIPLSEYDKNLYYAILAVDKDGNLGEISNVVKAFLPSPVLQNDVKTSPHSTGDVSNTELHSEKPSKILLYLIVGIVGFIVLCMFVVMIILVSFRRKKVPEDLETNKSTTTDNGFSVIQDELENISRDPEAKHFLLSSSNQDSNTTNVPTHSSLIRDESGSVSENPYGYTPRQVAPGYGWSATTNPYVYKDHNETYASIGSFHNTSQDSYIRGFQPTYAQPIPKNLRSQHIYSNAAVIARNSPHGSHSSIECSRGTVTFQAHAEPNLSRVSPDSNHSSEQTATPTKSILKKPKNLENLGDTTSDRDSQSSQCSSVPKEDSIRSPSTASSQPSQHSTLPPLEDPNLSIEKTYLETSFEFGGVGGSQEEAENAVNSCKMPPPTLPKPRGANQDVIVSSDNLSNSLDKKIRSCTQV